MPTKYVYCDCHNKYEALDREEVLAAITQAVNEGTISDIDTGFVTKIKEMNANAQLKFWVGTTAEFNAIATKAADTLYILSDDDTAEQLDLLAETVEGIMDGTTPVPNATNTEGLQWYNHMGIGDGTGQKDFTLIPNHQLMAFNTSTGGGNTRLYLYKPTAEATEQSVFNEVIVHTADIATTTDISNAQWQPGTLGSTVLPGYGIYELLSADANDCVFCHYKDSGVNKASAVSAGARTSNTLGIRVATFYIAANGTVSYAISWGYADISGGSFNLDQQPQSGNFQYRKIR